MYNDLKNVTNDPYFNKDLPFVPNPDYFPYVRGQLDRFFKENRISDYARDLYESKANSHWNSFYRSNETHFFKDRHWIPKEFPELVVEKTSLKMLNVGCGVGNSLIPLMKINSSLFCYAFDFSKIAIKFLDKELVKNSISKDRYHTFVHDATKEMPLDSNLVDYVLLVFTLSAISPGKHFQVFQQLIRVMKIGATLIFRDYFLGDYTFFKKKPNSRKTLSKKFFVKDDRTRVYFFEKEELIELLKPLKDKIKILDINVIERSIENRKEDRIMHRKFLQLVLKKVT